MEAVLGVMLILAIKNQYRVQGSLRQWSGLLLWQPSWGRNDWKHPYASLPDCSLDKSGCPHGSWPLQLPGVLLDHSSSHSNCQRSNPTLLQQKKSNKKILFFSSRPSLLLSGSGVAPGYWAAGAAWGSARPGLTVYLIGAWEIIYCPSRDSK